MNTDRRQSGEFAVDWGSRGLAGLWPPK
jgi:hypothetical protein